MEAKRKKYGGRVKGTPNKKTLQILDKLAEYDCDPIAKLVNLARDAEETGDKTLAANIYMNMCRYIYPVRKAVEVKADLTVMTHEEWLNSLND